jgi:hypothetical protein
MGLCLIKAARVFETMLEKGAVSEYRGDNLLSDSGLRYYGFFDKLPVGDDVPPTEDISFCWRWTDQCGGEIRAIIDAEIWHTGRPAMPAPTSTISKLGVASRYCRVRLVWLGRLRRRPIGHFT